MTTDGETGTLFPNLTPASKPDPCGCDIQSAPYRKLTCSDGSLQLRRECPNCGKRSNSIPHKYLPAGLTVAGLKEVTR